MRNLRLCDTMMANIQNSIATAGKANYTRADQVGFSYYKGRIMLYQRRLPQVGDAVIKSSAEVIPELELTFWVWGWLLQARAELSKAFALCQADAWGNGRSASKTAYRDLMMTKRD